MDRPFSDLGEDERNVLAVFQQYGRDTRAVTIASLAVHTKLEGEPKRLSLALKKLAQKGLIKEAGGDPFATSALAYRLAQPLPRYRGTKG